MLSRRVSLVIGLSMVLSINSFGQLISARDGESDSGSHAESDSDSRDNSGHSSGRDSENRSGLNSNRNWPGASIGDDRDHENGVNEGKSERDGSGKWQTDQDKALDAARKGEIISLKDALEQVANNYDGKVIAISLRKTSSRDIYQMKIRTPDGTIQEVRMDARTGEFAGVFGF